MLDKGQMKGADAGEAIAAEVGGGGKSGGRGKRQLGKRTVLAREIADWMRPRQKFDKRECLAAVEARVGPLADAEFGLALDVARNILRAEGTECAPPRGEPGVLAWADDTQAAKRAIKGVRKGARTMRKYAAMGDTCVRHESLPPVLRGALERTQERAAMADAASRSRKRLPGVD